MPTSWADSAEETYASNVGSSDGIRTGKSVYVPPHLRNKPAGNNLEASGIPRNDNSAPSYPLPPARTGTWSGGRNANSLGSGNLRGNYRTGSSGRGGRGWGNRSNGWDRKEENPFADDDGPLSSTEEENQGINFDAYEDIPVEVSGDSVPLPVSSFEETSMGNGIIENIRKCKFKRPTPVQRYAMPILLAGRDLMACAQTGSGKTAAFCFPIIEGIMKFCTPQRTRGARTAYPFGLILAPTRELSSQIHSEAKKFAYQTGVKVVVAYGGAPMSMQLRELERGVDILVATPGRLVDLLDRARVSLSMVRYLALDEADRMLDMGFEPQIRKIVQQTDMQPAGRRQTMLFSATFPMEIQVFL
eukprot:TRINITY_DN6014_c0_g1_i3.p1 TRINITY_DN6014_c0_g1~~TRINITY_DN6014_c0_g1_i3.p1  ORF type:complete len:359 (-),score=48.79 TRINITY_DN6014_c0_g1_i3:106-1182(-)